MKRSSFLLIGLFLLISSYSQTLFKSGYYINNNDDTIKCFIKDYDWENSPKAIKTKLSIDSPIIIKTIEEVKHFEIDNNIQYIRSLVKIDTSNVQLSNLSRQRNPEWKEKLLFLKVLVLGKASLYSYHDNISVKFFYKVDNGEIKQLVYKEFLGYYNNILMVNKYFQQQLINEVNCNLIKDISNLEYTKRDMIDYFIKYNSSVGVNVIQYNRKPAQRKYFSLKAFIGLNTSSIDVENPMVNTHFSFNSKLCYEFGLETEVILPFKNNKWRLICLPTFLSYQNNTEYYLSLFKVACSVDYKAIDIPVGIRYYYFLTDKLKINLTGVFVPSYSFNSSYIDMDSRIGSEDFTLHLNSIINYSFGLGVNYYRYNFDVRFNTNREIAQDYVFWGATYKSNVSLKLGYTFF